MRTCPGGQGFATSPKPSPVVGTTVGAVVGLGVGVAVDYVARAGGVDKAIGDAVSSGVDAVKGAASKVAGWFGW